ncbi:hypothetical protein PMI30_04656 [Pseudomonas sp. GM50]|nr:hypothetical protein PMI30_04656 [Pseudomonas sp. GM50]
MDFAAIYVEGLFNTGNLSNLVSGFRAEEIGAILVMS